MSILDKLISIIHFDVSKLKELHIGNIGSNNKNITVEYHDNRTIICIDPKTVDASEKEKVIQILKIVLDDQGLILEEVAKKLLDGFALEDKSKVSQDTLDYFKGKLPGQDLEIIRVALFIKSEFQMGHSIDQLKEDIRRRYGSRGNNIVNLYTAGYFNTVIKPLYQEMYAQKDFSITLFQARYNVIVTQVTFAVFVNKRINAEGLKSEVVRKIELNKKYGIKKLNIHGIGEDNVKKIQDLLNSIKSQIQWPPQIDSEKGFITVTIFF